MKQIFQEVIKTQSEYDKAMAYVNALIDEATEKGVLEPDADNKYTQEIGRVGSLCADFERNKMTFKRLAPRTYSPLVQVMREEMFKRDIKQNELAHILGINTTSLSLFISGKRHLSLASAKKLYTELNIDPHLILEYA